LVRFLLADMPAEGQSEFAFRDVNLHSVLSTTVEKAVVRMGGSRLRCHAPEKQPLATVELISTAEHLARLAARPNHTTLRVGPLELDLLDRTAKRGDRHIDLRPREFQLLKYMMHRSDTLLTRANLLTEVWNYKFVPESNLVDVHMSKLRRKIDGPNEFPIIRNVRGIGFVLGSLPSSQTSISTTAEPTGARASGNASGALDRLLQW
jgi:DNA-binding winged helix-turn-helix (wHTH) protein